MRTVAQIRLRLAAVGRISVAMRRFVRYIYRIRSGIPRVRAGDVGGCTFSIFVDLLLALIQPRP